MSIRNLIRISLIKTVTLVLGFIILVVFFPLLVLSYIPVYLYRLVFIKLSRSFRPDLIKILTPQSATYTLTQSETNVVIYLKLEGKPDDDWRWGFFKKVVLAKNPDGELIYPEFQQFVEIWCGFPFWKTDEHFSFYNHVYTRNYANEVDLHGIEVELLRAPFKKARSPWELVICERQDYSPDFAVFFKFHHTLADGYAVFNALLNWADSNPAAVSSNLNPPTTPPTTTALCSKIQEVVDFVLFPPRASYDLAKTAIDQYLSGNLWGEFTFQNKSDSRIYLKSKSLELTRLRGVSAELKVPLTAVVVATISKGIVNFLKKSEKCVPEYISCPIPVPLPKPRDKKRAIGLQNAFTVGQLKISFSISDNSERYKSCALHFQEMKSSRYQSLVHLMLLYAGKLPVCFLDFTPKMMDPLFVSNFAGPKTPLKLDGFKVTDMSFSVNFSKCYPLVLTMLSYNGRMRIILNVDSNLLNSESTCLELLNEIEKEFESV